MFKFIPATNNSAISWLAMVPITKSNTVSKITELPRSSFTIINRMVKLITRYAQRGHAFKTVF